MVKHSYHSRIIQHPKQQLWLVALLCLSFFGTCTITIAKANETIHLVLPDFPPYSYQHNNKITGIAIELVTPVLAQLNRPYQLTLVKDYGIALHLIKRGMADGFMLASQNNHRDQVAQFSTPIITNRWCWYINKSVQLTPNDKLSFKRNAEIGTIAKTNTERWLLEHGYSIKAAPLSSKALANLLLEGKINAAFVSEKVFDLALAQNNAQVAKIIAVEKPFGIYISKAFIKKHPHFMDKLNQAIKSQTNTIHNSQ